MFSEIFHNLNNFANHHQVIIAAIVTLSFICVSWGIEKILEQYVFHKNSLYGYITLVILGVLVLWLVQHYILHAI